MNQLNANIILAPTRLNRPLPTLYARLGHSFVAQLTNIPDDVTSVSIRIFSASGFFDIPAGRRPDGTAIVNILGSCFPVNGSTKYEIHCFDALGNPTALGMGYVYIEDFSQSGTPITPGQSVVLDHIKDANGVLHTIKAVLNEDGEYTTIIDG